MTHVNLAMLLSSDDILEKYSLDRKIGQGAFGEVYVGQNIETGAIVNIQLNYDCQFLIFSFLQR